VEFNGFTASDFDAYQQSKWTSNVYNLERLGVKQKLEALGRHLLPELQDGDGAPLAHEVSSEHPAVFNQRRVENQYLFFLRTQEARRELETIINRSRSIASLVEDPSPLRNHIFISVMIDSEQLEVGLKLHSDAAVDRDNLLHKCHDFFQRERFIGLVHDLSSEFRVGLVGQPSAQAQAQALDDDRLGQLLEQLPSAGTWLAVSNTIGRDRTLALGAAVAPLLVDQLKSLLPLLHFVAWRRDNDFISVRETLREKDVKQKSKGLKPHDRVRVMRGVFAGKVGKVQSVDAKGAVKVQLGTLSVKLEADDVQST
jgi:transcription antitermination factor NusG